MSNRPVVYLIASAAPPVRQLDEPLALLDDAGYSVCVILTPTAATWIDPASLETKTGFPVRVHPRLPDEQDPLPPADAVLAAPTTFNTFNKAAAGISDTLAASLLNELLGADIPMVFAPCVKQTLRQHPAYQSSLNQLSGCGVKVLEPDSITGRGQDNLATFNWSAIVFALLTENDRDKSA
ncbi:MULTISPECIES: flavoprotein [Saccharopolyspora]|uniref:Flavoprotein n=1 Tax=Saccharopolyspora aridisoli TaxID=2530385 RepID=A0A4R4UGS7_9PSEU|nr:flavoprotein [Saccharopolyspora aridisoli]TDC88144.1 flavoprotein [Saccharopolyspora aridisoli]